MPEEIGNTRTRDERGNRTDDVRPSVFDPADYRVTGYVDAFGGREDDPGGGAEAVIDDEDRFYELADLAMGGLIFDPVTGICRPDGTWDGACQHCGHRPIRWVAIVERLSTGRGIAFGAICAERASLADRDALQLRTLQRRAEARREAQRRLNQSAEHLALWLTGDPVGWRMAGSAEDREAVTEFLFEEVTDDEPYRFLRELRERLGQWGDLSDRQVAAALRVREERQHPREERPAPTVPAPEGRVEVTGEVVKVEWRENDFGGSLKMVVRLDDGNAVWSTVPSALTIVPAAWGERNGQRVATATRSLERGDRIRFTATFQRSERDEHFAFAKRPARATLLEGETQ